MTPETGDIAMTSGRIAAAAMAMAAAIGLCAPQQAQAGDKATVAAGVIGGLSAGAIMAGAGYPYIGYPYPYARYPAYGYGFYPGYPGPVYAVAPTFPPPGCVIRAQRVWNGVAWRTRKIRVCY
jgi:hypothetical protein